MKVVLLDIYGLKMTESCDFITSSFIWRKLLKEKEEEEEDKKKKMTGSVTH